ncbi:hypothetical protein Syun_015699 [Stephania yunnanensis]|uniref:Uncharacterized protein n=1 Tax=Stephania yunnanensis TaxID=152371 RepID=A0AAP0JM77_9MAGN
MDSRFTNEDILRGLYEIQLGLKCIVKKFDTFYLRSSSPPTVISREDRDHTMKMLIVSDPSTMRNNKHEGIQDLAPSNPDVLQSNSELRILSNLGVQSSPNPDQIANLLSTPVLWIQASPFVLSRKAPDPPNSTVSELIRIIGDLDLVATEVFTTVEVIDMVKNFRSDEKSKIQGLLLQIDKSRLHPLASVSKVLGVQQIRYCSGVQLPNPQDLTLLADNLSFCCTTVGLLP